MLFLIMYLVINFSYNPKKYTKSIISLIYYDDNIHNTLLYVFNHISCVIKDPKNKFKYNIKTF